MCVGVFGFMHTHTHTGKRHARTHAQTHARTHARTHAHTHTHTNTPDPGVVDVGSQTGAARGLVF